MDQSVFTSVEANLDISQLSKVIDLQSKLQRLKKEQPIRIIETEKGFRICGELNAILEFNRTIGNQTFDDAAKCTFIRCEVEDHIEEIEHCLDNTGYIGENPAIPTTSSSKLEFPLAKFCYAMLDKWDKVTRLLHKNQARMRIKKYSDGKVFVIVKKASSSNVTDKLIKLFEASYENLDTSNLEVCNVTAANAFLDRVFEVTSPILVVMKRQFETNQKWDVGILDFESKIRRTEKKVITVIDAHKEVIDVEKVLMANCDGRFIPQRKEDTESRPANIAKGMKTQSKKSEGSRMHETAIQTIHGQSNARKSYSEEEEISENGLSSGNDESSENENSSKKEEFYSQLKADNSKLTRTQASKLSSKSKAVNYKLKSETGRFKSTADLSKSSSTLVGESKAAYGESIAVNDESKASNGGSKAMDDESKEILIGDEDVIDYMMKFYERDLVKIKAEYGLQIDSSRKQEGLLFLRPAQRNLDEGESKLSTLAHAACLNRTEQIDLSNISDNVYMQRRQEALDRAELLNFLVRSRTRYWRIIGPGKRIQECVRVITETFHSSDSHKYRTQISGVRREKTTTFDEESKADEYAMAPASLSKTTQKAYLTKELVVLVWVGDITKLHVDVVVNAANERLKHTGGVARAIATAAGESLVAECKQFIDKNRRLAVGEVCATTAGRMPAKKVFHTVGPQWRKYSNKDQCAFDLQDAFYNCLVDAHRDSLTSIAFPAISSGLYGVPLSVVAETAVKAIKRFCRKYPFPKLQFVHFVDIYAEAINAFQKEFEKSSSFFQIQPGYSKFTEWLGGVRSKTRTTSNMSDTKLSALATKQMLVTTKEDSHTDLGHGKKEEEEEEEEEEEICSICMEKPINPKILQKCNHMFCTKCIDECFEKMSPKCPNCGVVYGEIRGNQPDGTMEVAKEDISLPGYEKYGTLVIFYDIPSGVQADSHPHPGRRYHGTQRQAFLPNNSEGRKVLKLLKRAFEAKMIFTVGTSSTTGKEDMVVWNCIHHKTKIHGGTNSYGYPDPTYLQRVQEELAAQGFT